MITLVEVIKTYPLSKGNSVTAVRGVSLEIEQGEFLIIVGRSGSGKTTLLNLAAGLTRPTSGETYLDGINLWSLTDEKQSALRSQRIGFVFQFPSLLPSLTALENVSCRPCSTPRRMGTARSEPSSCSSGWGWKISCRPTRASFPPGSSSGW